MQITVKDKWYVITEIGVKNLLFDALKEYSDIVLNHYRVTLRKIPLTIKEVEKFGNYLLPWFEDGNWATGHKSQTVSNITKHSKLKKDSEFKIILAKSKRGTLIVDGCHRAIALWQNRVKLKDIQGTIYIIESPHLNSIFAHDLIRKE